jgi:glycosyltransferase involved in cell wall biosynthesis
LPTLELSCAAVDYGAANGVPVALDVRDLWPDVLFDMLPVGTRGVARHAMHWMTRQLRRSATGATAILGVTDEFVQWGVEAARRPPTSRDRAFPMGYSSRMPNQEDLNAAREFWIARGLDEAPQRPIVCFFGTFGWMFDFKTVMFAAERLPEVAPELRLVLCGTGGKIEEIRRRASGLSNVLLPGYVGPSEIWDLMRRSIAGLAPYRPLRNFDDNLPNKPIEYLSAGLPIISCELRLLKRLIEQYECGLTYAHGDVDGLVNAVLRLLHNPTLRASMSRRAGQLYADRFTAEVVYDSMASHLEALVEVEGSPRAPLRQV